MCETEKYNLQTCYHCGNTGLMRIEHTHEYDFSTPILNELGELIEIEPDDRLRWQLLSCPVCHKVTLWEKTSDIILEYSYSKILYPVSTLDYSGVPEEIKTAFESALKVKRIDTAICALALRRVLESICKERGAEGKTLDLMIKDMISKGILPPMFDDACWIIRQLGNSAAHADKKVFSLHQVDQTIEFIQNIIFYLYTLPVKVQMLRKDIEAEKEKKQT